MDKGRNGDSLQQPFIYLSAWSSHLTDFCPPLSLLRLRYNDNDANQFALNLRTSTRTVVL